MKKNKTNKIIILSLIGVIFIVSLLIFILNYSKDDSSFSILEKKWINDNANNIIDISVFNDVSVFGKDGKGVIFDYIDQFTDSYGVDFNKVSYLTSDPSNMKDISFKILNVNEEPSESDILIYEDKFALISLDNISIDKISDLSYKKIGVITEELSNISYYLFDAVGCSFTPYIKSEDLVMALKNKEVDFIIVPENQYLESIFANDFKIDYHFTDLSKKYVLNVNNNKTLLNIMNKYKLQFDKNYYDKSYKNNFLEVFFNASDISESARASYNSSSYTYGYVVNMPYENSESKEFVGIISNYLSKMEDLFDIDYKIVKYKNIESLKQAFSNGEIDAMFANFNTDGVNVDVIKTTSLFKEDYVVLSKNYFTIDSIRSLKNLKVNCVSNTYLANYLTSNEIEINGYANTDELLRNLGNNSIVIMDKNTYMYYQNGKLASYNVLYENTLNNEYTFAIRDVNKNEVFAKLFSYFVSSVNYNDIKYSYNTNLPFIDTNVLGTTLKYIFISLITLLILVLIIIIIIKKKKKESILKKEEKIKFIDSMTSLKNRNYLNYNIKKWDENVIYPQSFVVIDLNNIKYINDNHGHEEGDMVIKKAASVLIVNQLEKTDIMRTDGNEFLVYMIGYSENQVMEYIRKIYKELKSLPYGYGASIGYSMITDDVKTVDDAINEATLEMRNSKEKNQKE